MSTLELRPLSIGELLDRTFSLYRRNFLLFIGISAIPQLLVLALQLAQLAFTPVSVPVRPSVTTDFQSVSPGFSTGGVVGILGLVIVGIVIYVIAYLFSQGGTVFAVSELYLGRATTIGQSLGRVRGELGSLFGVVVLNGLVTGISFLLLIIPGIYMVCRLCVCIPAALLENLGPRESLERSFGLTKDNVGRAFLILLLYFVILYAALFLFDIPFAIGIQFEAHDPSMVRLLSALMQVGNFIAGVLITPILTIACSIFYFDLRVRKEAFDLQLMMNPLAGAVPAPPSATSLLS
jgi:predicted secreted protein